MFFFSNNIRGPLDLIKAKVIYKKNRKKVTKFQVKKKEKKKRGKTEGEGQKISFA
jgi:ribosomal protein L19E